MISKCSSDFHIDRSSWEYSVIYKLYIIYIILLYILYNIMLVKSYRFALILWFICLVKTYFYNLFFRKFLLFYIFYCFKMKTYFRILLLDFVVIDYIYYPSLICCIQYAPYYERLIINMSIFDQYCDFCAKF